MATAGRDRRAFGVEKTAAAADDILATAPTASDATGLKVALNSESIM